MSTYCKGFREPTADYRKKVAAWRACEAAGVRPPRELMEMFDGNEPDDAGQEVDIDAATTQWSDNDCRSGIEVTLSKLPPGVTAIRFIISH